MTTRRFTLIEVAIASVMFSVVIALALGVLTHTNRNVGSSLKVTQLALRADRLAKRVREELSQAVDVSVNVTHTQVPGVNTWTTAQYRKIVGVTAQGLPVPGPVRELRFRYDEAPDLGTIGNDADDDGDGLIDEGSLELWEGGALVGALARDLSSAAERYEPGGAPWQLYPNGTRGGPLAFRFTDPTQQLQSGQRGIAFTFALVTRLPLLATKGGDPFPAFHHELRRVNVAFRSTTP